MSLWVPPSSIPAKNDGDTLTAKDLKDVIASLQDLLNGRLGNVNINTAMDLSERIAAFKVIFPGDVRFADDYATGSATGGIQEAIDDLKGSPGKVVCSGKTYLTSTPIYLHSNTHLMGAGIGVTIIKRANGSINNSNSQINNSNGGCVVTAGPYGMNGTRFNSTLGAGSFGVNVSISELTIDGNYSGNGSLTAWQVLAHGLFLQFIIGANITNVMSQNTLMDGFTIQESNDVIGQGLYCDTIGQLPVVSSKNALSIYNREVGYGKRICISNFTFKGIGESSATRASEGIAIANCAGPISISNGQVDGADFGIELGGDGFQDMKDYTFSNINFTNLLNFGITFNAINGGTYESVLFSNLLFEGTATTNDGGAFYGMAGSTNSMKNVHVENCHWRNINSKDTTAISWIDFQPGAATAHDNVSFAHCSFYGKAGSVRSSDYGLNLRQSMTNFSMTDCIFKDVPGGGILLHNNINAQTMSTVRFSGVTVDGANALGFFVTSDTSASTIKEVYFSDCVAKDCCKQTGATGFGVYANFAGSSINNIYFNRCRSYKTSGTTHQYGLDVSQSAGTLDKVSVIGCDFSGTQTGWFFASGTPTNVRFQPPTGKGTDIASAATIVIPPDGSVFHVTGTTNITNGITVNPWDNGRKVKLIFDGILTVSAAGTSKLAGAMVTTADDSLVLTCDGTNWNEDGRSINA